MSSFFERHKRKSLWALLLLLLMRSRVVIILLLAVMIFLYLFRKDGFARGIPWVDKMAQRVEVAFNIPGGQDMSLGSLTKIIWDNTSENKSWALWSGRGVQASYSQKRSSLDMVKGIDLTETFGQSQMRSKDTRTVSGIVNPEYTKDVPKGVPLDYNELLSGLVRNANAGEVNDPGALTHGQAISPESRAVPTGFAGFGAGSGGGVRHGRLSSFAWNRASSAISGGMQGPSFRGYYSPKKYPLYALAEVFAYSCLAAPPAACIVRNPQPATRPPASCSTTGCASEFAYVTAGSAFDGGTTGGLGILEATSDPIGVPANAQANVNLGRNGAKGDQLCSQDVLNQYSNRVAQNQNNFATCCQQAVTLNTTCKQNCPWYTLGLICNNNCASVANSYSTQTCEQMYGQNTFDSETESALSHCPGYQAGSNQGAGWVSCTQF